MSPDLTPLSGDELDEAIREATAQACAVATAAVEQAGGPALRLGREALRLRLIRKARRGRYDRRMCRYWGVDPEVNFGCRHAIRRAYAMLLVPTSTRRWPAGTGSYHNARERDGDGLAVDHGNIARHVGPTAEGRRRLVAYQRKEFEAWKRGDRPFMVELIGPDNNMVVLRGRWAPLPEGSQLEQMHDNHDHQAFRR